MPDLTYDPLVPRQAAGGVLINAEGKVLLREPKNHYGGYIWTFPKGGVDDGETHPQAALREVREEVGWVGHIVGRLAVLGGDTSETTYYLMRPVRQAGRFDNETQAIEWVDRTEAERRISMTLSSKGKIRDLTVLRLAYEAHLRMTGGKMSAEECIVESAAYVDIHNRKFTEAELRWLHTNYKSPSYEISFDDWLARHYTLSEAYGIETAKSGMDAKGKPSASDIAKVDAVLADDKLPATAEEGKAYVVHWAGGRGIFALRKKSALRPWLDSQGEWADLISIKYKAPEHGGKPLKVAESAQPDTIAAEDNMDIDIPEELVEDDALLPPAQVVNEDSFTDALIHGKAVLLESDVSPRLFPNHLVHRVDLHPERISDAARRLARSAPTTYVEDDVSRQLAGAMLSVQDVLGLRDVLEVAGGVVPLVTVLVVDDEARRAWTMECLCHENMDTAYLALTPTPWVKLDESVPVRGPRVVGCQDAQGLRVANASVAGRLVARVSWDGFPKHGHNHVPMVAESIDGSFKDALIHGKAILVNNIWWQIAGRDLKSDKVALVVSKYAKADGYKDQKPKTMRLSALVQKIKSGKWGANINGKRYGPEQDAKKRDSVRKAAGLTAAPGAGKFRKDESEDILALYKEVSARANAIHDQIPKTTNKEAKLALWKKRDALADEANALFKKLSQCQKDEVIKAEHDRLAQRMVGIFKRGMTETLDDEIVESSELLERMTVPAGNNVLRFLSRHVQAEDHEDAANMEVDNDRRRLSDNVSIFWAKATAAWDALSLPEQHEAFNAIDAGTYRALVNAPPRGVRAREIFKTFDDVTVTAFNEAVMKQSKAMEAREARLRARGFTYRANPNAPPAKKGYPPMVRRWAKDEGFPLPTMQRMWDMAVEEVDSSGDLDRPDPGQRNPRAIEFWKETTRLFRSMVAARKSLEA